MSHGLKLTVLNRPLISSLAPHTRLRAFSTSKSSNKFLDKYFVKNEDLDKRPSDLEIQQKGLPKNTPTLAERIRRDQNAVFYADDRKGGYYKGTGTLFDYVPKDVTLYDVLTESYQSAKEELWKWKAEMESDEWLEIVRPGDEKTIWKFDTEKDRRDWILTCDSTWGEGYSTAKLIESPSGQGALFTGDLVTRPPPDGRIQKAGYAAIKSVVRRKSFYRLQYFDWEEYTHLTLRVRGDGRTYLVNLHPYGYWDFSYFDLWSYPLYTRGGPYWQTVKIPFSKFMFTSKAALMDEQMAPKKQELVAVGITQADGHSGPFSLEIDKIGVLCDPYLDDCEETAYESYLFTRPAFNMQM